MAAGGIGVAGGMAALGVVSESVAIAVAGILVSSHFENLEEAHTYYEKVKEQCTKIDF